MIGKANAENLAPTVLMTADAVGGVWSYAAGLCRALPEIRFILATMGPRPSPAQRGEIAGLSNTVLIESSYDLEWMAISGADLAKSRDWLVALAERHHVDLIHVNGYAHAQLGNDRPILLVAHSDVSSWWQAVHKRCAPPEWDRYREQVVAGLTAATRIVAPTAAVLRDLELHYVRFQNKTEVISNGIDFAAFPPLPKAPVVMAAGRIWDAAKNLATLEAIAPDVVWPVEIAGEIQHPEGDAARYSNVRLLGRLTHAEMAWHLGCASIFVAPARYEPFGLAILEAAAAGCALVLGDIPALRENWDGVAVFVDPEDGSALKSAINNLIADPGRRNRVAAAGQCRARDFNLSRMARAYAGLYRKMTRASARLETA
jgi:glycosyltransferase involved in cell wall biosynthesis